MRILHLADLHIGKIFHDVHMTDDQTYILNQIVGIVQDKQVDVVVISGDVYDRSVPPVQATVAMDNFLTSLLLDVGVKVIIIPGNHDSAERLSFGGRLVRSQGLHIASGLPGPVEPVRLSDEHGVVTFIPLPYIEPHLVRKTVDDPEVTGFDAAFQSVLQSLDALEGRTVCLAHCFTQGGTTSESERPLSIGGSSLVNPSHFASFSLTLLGHLHRPQKISESIFYAGSPLKYSFSESDHQKQVAIYDLAADGSFTRETIPLVPLREVRVIRGDLSGILTEAVDDPASDDYVWVDLTDRGALFDYAASIRTCYPNVLSITRSEFQRERGADESIEIRSKSDREIAASFFRHVTGTELDPEESRLMETVLEEMVSAGGDQ